MAKRQPSSRYVLAGSIAEIPRMNRGMTVRGGVTISSSSRYVLAAKRYRGGCKLKICYKRNKRELLTIGIAGVCDRRGVDNRLYQGYPSIRLNSCMGHMYAPVYNLKSINYRGY
ncbi:MAG: hypothetical protein ACEY3M_13365 [Wolbachia sp.]